MSLLKTISVAALSLGFLTACGTGANTGNVSSPYVASSINCSGLSSCLSANPFTNYTGSNQISGIFTGTGNLVNGNGDTVNIEAVGYTDLFNNSTQTFSAFYSDPKTGSISFLTEPVVFQGSSSFSGTTQATHEGIVSTGSTATTPTTGAANGSFTATSFSQNVSMSQGSLTGYYNEQVNAANNISNINLSYDAADSVQVTTNNVLAGKTLTLWNGTSASLNNGVASIVMNATGSQGTLNIGTTACATFAFLPWSFNTFDALATSNITNPICGVYTLLNAANPAYHGVLMVLGSSGQVYLGLTGAAVYSGTIQ